MLNTDIFLFGKPGAGKGTLANDLLKADSNFIHLSTGEVFRSNVDKKTLLGNEIRMVLESGDFINDELTIAVVEDFIVNAQESKNIIFDGFPRNEVQLEWIMNFYNENDRINPIFVELDADDEVCITRIKSRATLLNRADDVSNEIISKRFKDFYTKTASLKEIFERYNEDKVVTLNANGTAHDVVLQLYKKLSKM